MDYGYVIRVAWAVSRRHPFLWVLGLFASSGIASCSGMLHAPFWAAGGTAWLAPAAFGALDALGNLRSPSPGSVAGVLVFVLLALAAFAVLSSIAAAGMARATTGLLAGAPVTAGGAWQVGVRLFRRYLGLALIGVAYVVLTILAIALVLFLASATSSSGSGGGMNLLVLGLLALVVVLAAFVGWVVYVVAAQYAALEMAVSDVGPIRALRLGIGLMRRELGATLALWIVAILLGLGASVLLGIAFLLLVAMLSGLGAVVYFATAGELAVGVPSTTIVFAAMSAITAIAALWGAAAFLNTFLWSYWAAAYMRLRQPPQVPHSA